MCDGTDSQKATKLVNDTVEIFLARQKAGNSAILSIAKALENCKTITPELINAVTALFRELSEIDDFVLGLLSVLNYNNDTDTDTDNNDDSDDYYDSDLDDISSD